jgi:hypothetical protein
MIPGERNHRGGQPRLGLSLQIWLSSRRHTFFDHLEGARTRRLIRSRQSLASRARRRFFAQQARLYIKPANASTVITALRGYFRYRVVWRRGARVDRCGVLPCQLAVGIAPQGTNCRGSRAVGRFARPRGALHETRRRHRALRHGSQRTHRSTAFHSIADMSM